MTAAPRTLLQMVVQAQRELGLPEAGSVVGNTDATTNQMRGILQQIGEELRDVPEDGWTSMHAEYDLAVQPATVLTGCTTTLNSPIVGVPSTAGLVAGAMQVNSLAGVFPTACRLVSIGVNQVTMSMVATATLASDTMTFAQDTYTLPADFKNYSNRTMWDRTNRWELLGPDSPQMDQWHRSGIVVTGPRRHFRNVGRIQAVNPTWRLWPPPFEITSPLQLSFEYLSTDWISLQGGAGNAPNPPVYGSEWANDTDIPVLNDRALIDGMKWMFWFRKGFNALAEQAWWVDLVDRLIARDGAAPTLQLAKRVHPIFISPANVQDGFFAGPVGPNTGN